MRFIGFSVFLSFWFSVSVLGQGKFLEGYILSPGKDTTRGFIRYEGWDVSPDKIDFARIQQGPFESMTCGQVSEFYIKAINEKYVCKKIGVLNIDLSQTYAIAPSIEAKDSVMVFLKVITSGSRATLFEHLNGQSESHYYLEIPGQLTELINYPFYRTMGNKKYLLTYDQYKKQLVRLLSDSEMNLSVPMYSEKGLRKYVDAYNESFDGKKIENGVSSESDFEFDINFNAGTEAWKEPGLKLENKATFGVGVRMNLPRRFHNRYFKINFSMIPGASVTKMYNYIPDEKINLKTVEFGVGTFVGSGKIRPNIGMDYSYPMDSWRSTIIGPHMGIAYNRKFSLEISHFANFNTLFSDIAFFNRPRISLNYYLNLNSLFRKP